MSVFIVCGMARFKDVITGLTQQMVRKSEELTRELEELNGLRAGWQRYQELSKQVESKQRLVKVSQALLLNAPLNIKADAGADVFAPRSNREWKEAAEGLGITVELNDFDLANFPLWRIIREVVRQTTEIRIYELEAYLKQFGLKKATRPAIESALGTHPREFRIVKRGREKYVSLK
jgi:hypothetical protein